MLEHQLPALPPWEVFWEALPEFFAWLTGATEISQPRVYSGSPNEETIRLRTPSLHFAGSDQSFIEIIRFAASSVLLP